MQLLPDHQTLMAAVKDISMSISTNMPLKVTSASSDNFEVKSKTSDASLRLMNPVASGDNVATCLNSAHKLKEEAPPLIPCCEGRELQINEDLVRSGLSAISVKHENSVTQSVSMSRACEKPQVAPGLVKHRNSFRSLHRPDLKRVPYLRRLTPDELETLFRGYAAELPARPAKTENRDDAPRLDMPPDENVHADMKRKEMVSVEDGALSALHPIPEARSGAEDVPAGMRLHGARARLYTSVLAGARAGDQLDGSLANVEFDVRVPDDLVPEDEVALKEELQIILPPRCDDVTAGSSTTTAATEASSTS